MYRSNTETFFHIILYSRKAPQLEMPAQRQIHFKRANASPASPFQDALQM
jgi:hypothetical protein